MWLGETITEKGIGNGMSLLIFTSIAATFPGSLWAIQQRDGRWDIFFGVIAGLKKGKLFDTSILFVSLIIIAVLAVFGAVLAALTAPVATFDAQGRWSGLNEAAELWLNLSTRSVAGLRADDPGPHGHDGPLALTPGGLRDHGAGPAPTSRRRDDVRRQLTHRALAAPPRGRRGGAVAGRLTAVTRATPRSSPARARRRGAQEAGVSAASRRSAAGSLRH